MKTKLITSITLVGAMLFSSCDDAVESPLNRDQVILDRIEKNEGISYNMFRILGERMTADSLMALTREASTKTEFIDAIGRNTDDYFSEVVEEEISSFDITTIPAPYAGEAEITLKGLVSREAGVAPDANLVEDYRVLILKQIDEQAAKGREGWIVVDASASSSSESKPSETLSLNYGKILFLATEVPAIMMDPSLDAGGVWKTVNNVLYDNDIPPVAIGLLLPAVQKVREAAAIEDPFNASLDAWLTSPIGNAINGGLNRDIIRRIHATVFLAALHTIVLEQYSGATVDEASLSVLHARYRAALIVGSAEVWGN